MLYDAVVVMYNISCVRPKRKPTIIILHTFWQDYVGVVKQLPPILRQHDTYPPHTSSLVGMLISVTRHTHPVYSLLPSTPPQFIGLRRTVQVKQNVLDSGIQGVSLEWHARKLTEATHTVPSLT